MEDCYGGGTLYNNGIAGCGLELCNMDKDGREDKSVHHNDKCASENC